jgi:uncharacterized protein (TIGR02246 family)
MDAFAQLFAADAEFVNVVGLWWKGRAEIKRAHEFTHLTMFKNSQLTILESSVRFPLPQVALARARWSLEGHVGPDDQPLPPRTGILLCVVLPAGSGWSIIDAQNTDIVEGELSRPQ